MKKAVLFDLDDTLYEEGDYFRSGFAAVAKELESRGVGPCCDLSRMMETIHFTEGREGVIGKMAERISFPPAWVPELLQALWSHSPNIALAKDVEPVLSRLRVRYKVGCITDGHADVQRRKIEVLKVTPLLDAIVIADDRGRDYWKPSPLPFLECCDMLSVEPSDAVFVGDNPAQDMRGARVAGITSVRIRRERGYFADSPSNGDEPDFELVSLDELEALLDAL